MNVITIYKPADFEFIIDTEILVTHDSSRQKDEIYSNMWCIMLSSDYARKKPREDILAFFDYLIKALQRAIHAAEISGPITMYSWYDGQVAQLRYNILSGKVEKLPFGCRVHLIDQIDLVIDAFLQNGACGLIKPFDEQLSEEELAKLEEATPENTILTVFCTYIY